MRGYGAAISACICGLTSSSGTGLSLRGRTARARLRIGGGLRGGLVGIGLRQSANRR
jgi:hypothetical protein